MEALYSYVDHLAGIEALSSRMSFSSNFHGVQP